MDPEIVLSAIPLLKPKSIPPKTGIICTVAPLGSDGEPAGEAPIDRGLTKERIKGLAEAGMNVVRINFSHVYSEPEKENVWAMVNIVREISKETRKPIGIMMDLCGPRLRVGRIIEKPPVNLRKGKSYILSTKNIEGNDEQCSITYPDFAKDIKLALESGQDVQIFIDDGKIKLKPTNANEEEVICEIVVGGKLESNKGINIPHCRLGVAAFTNKDLEDLLWVFEKENEERKRNEDFRAINYVALSFVKKRDDLLLLKSFLRAKERKEVPIIAKIETAESVDSFDNMKEILDELKGSEEKETGGLMIARGDLAIETSHERVPEIQTKLIVESNKRGIPVIVATQMLESMCSSPTPYRSEVVDVVNAVREGADMVMLSKETARGSYPLEATKTMADILKRADNEEVIWITKEEVINFVRDQRLLETRMTTTEAIAGPACELAKALASPAIVVGAATGTTARMCSRFRPKPPIIAITRKRSTAHNLLLHRGVYPVLVGCKPKELEDLLEVMRKILQELKIGKKDDLVVTTFGSEPGMAPLGTNGELKANTLRIIRIDWD